MAMLCCVDDDNDYNEDAKEEYYFLFYYYYYYSKVYDENKSTHTRKTFLNTYNLYINPHDVDEDLSWGGFSCCFTFSLYFFCILFFLAMYFLSFCFSFFLLWEIIF